MHRPETQLILNFLTADTEQRRLLQTSETCNGWKTTHKEIQGIKKLPSVDNRRHALHESLELASN